MEAVILCSEPSVSMLPVDGRPVIGHILDALTQWKVGRVVICGPQGLEDVRTYCMVEFPELFYVFQEDDSGDATASTYHMYLACDEFDQKEDLLIINGNLAFDSDLISPLVDQKGTAIAVDWGSFAENSYHVSVREGRVLSIAADQFAEESYGRAVGIYKVAESDKATFLEEVARGVEKFRECAHPLEMVLDRLFLSGVLWAYPCKITTTNWKLLGETRAGFRAN